MFTEQIAHTICSVWLTVVLQLLTFACKDLVNSASEVGTSKITPMTGAVCNRTLPHPGHWLALVEKCPNHAQFQPSIHQVK